MFLSELCTSFNPPGSGAVKYDNYTIINSSTTWSRPSGVTNSEPVI